MRSDRRASYPPTRLPRAAPLSPAFERTGEFGRSTVTGMIVVTDLTLAVLLTLRLVRLTIADDIGYYLIQRPVNRWHARRAGPGRARAFWISGLTCPFCIGFWLGVVVLLSLWLVGGPGHAAEWWRWAAGAMALNYVVGHVGSRLGDAGFDDDEDAR